MFDSEVLRLAERALGLCRERGWRLATAESCTGGLIAAALTAIAGSSDVFERGFVTYSNQAKNELLGVAPAMIAQFGAVSAETAGAMARGAIARSPVDVALSITGIAGPGGGSAAKPVGLVYLALARRDGLMRAEGQILPGDRAAIRDAAVRRALEMLVAESQPS